MNGKKKEKKPHVNSPGKRYSLLHYLRESRYLTDNLYSHRLAFSVSLVKELLKDDRLLWHKEPKKQLVAKIDEVFCKSVFTRPLN